MIRRGVSRRRWKPATLALAIDVYAAACAVVLVSQDGFPSWFWLPHSVVVLLSLVLIGYTLRDVSRQPAIDDRARMTWAIAVLLVGALALPAYYLCARDPQPRT